MVGEGWALIPWSPVSLGAQYVFSLVEILTWNVCHLPAYSSVPSAPWSGSVMSVMSFFLLIWAVVSFLLPSVRLDLFDIFFHTLATLPLHLPPPFLETRRMTPSSLPFVLWANSVELFYGLELRAASALNTSPLDCETNEKSKMTSSKRKWFMLWRETWKDTPPRTHRALFFLLSTAGLTHFKITSQFS